MANITRLFEEFDEDAREIIVREGIHIYEAFSHHFETTSVNRTTSTETIQPKEMVRLTQNIAELRREIDGLQREKERSMELKEREIATLERLIKDKEQEVEYEKAVIKRMKETQMDDIQKMMKQREEHFARMMAETKAMYDGNMKHLTRENERVQTNLEKLTHSLEVLVKDGVEKQTQILRRKITELELENRRYHELYDSREKGLAFEDEIEEAMNEYNTMYVGGVWDIKRVGQLSGGGKGDFILRHKDGRLTVLIDAKNNLPTSAVSRDDVLKFIGDVNERHGLVQAGIMLARNNISNRARFQMDDAGVKPLLYVSRFEARHVGYLFSLLDFIAVKVGGDAVFDKRVYMEKLMSDYQFNKKQMVVHQEQIRLLDMKQTEIVNEYKVHFDEDIMIAIDNRDQVKKVGGKKILKASSGAGASTETETEEDTTSYEEKEKGRIIKGRRSKYYLMYSDKEGEVIQYFRNNSEREKKREILDKRSANLVDMSKG